MRLVTGQQEITTLFFMYKWKCERNNHVFHHCCTDSFVPKATPTPLSCCYERRISMKALCRSIFDNWYSDTENSLAVDCSNYCCYRYCCFRLHIQDNIAGKKERKKNNQQNQQPLSPPKAISHLYVYAKFCSKRLEQNVQQTQRLQQALQACAT